MCVCVCVCLCVCVGLFAAAGRAWSGGRYLWPTVMFMEEWKASRLPSCDWPLQPMMRMALSGQCNGSMVCVCVCVWVWECVWWERQAGRGGRGHSDVMFSCLHLHAGTKRESFFHHHGRPFSSRLFRRNNNRNSLSPPPARSLSLSHTHTHTHTHSKKSSEALNLNPVFVEIMRKALCWKGEKERQKWAASTGWMFSILHSFSSSSSSSSPPPPPSSPAAPLALNDKTCWVQSLRRLALLFDPLCTSYFKISLKFCNCLLFTPVVNAYLQRPGLISTEVETPVTHLHLFKGCRETRGEEKKKKEGGSPNPNH